MIVPQFTPAPWKARGKNGKYDNRKNTWSVCDEGSAVRSSTSAPITLANGKVIAFAVASAKGYQTDDGEVDANATLIAAAPDLFALAQKYASECGECDGLGYVVKYVDPYDCGDVSSPERVCCSECADIRAVIAKATGAQS